MNRKGTVVAAGGLSVMLLAGSSAFAIESGAFATHPVDRVGTFQSIQAGLVLHARPTSSPAATAASSTTRPERSGPSNYAPSSVATTRAASVPRTVLEVAPTSASYAASSTVPVTEGGRGGVTPVQPTTPPSVARRAPSTSLHRPDDDRDDDPDPSERPHRGSDD